MLLEDIPSQTKVAHIAGASRRCGQKVQDAVAHDRILGHNGRPYGFSIHEEIEIKTWIRPLMDSKQLCRLRDVEEKVALMRNSTGSVYGGENRKAPSICTIRKSIKRWGFKVRQGTVLAKGRGSVPMEEAQP